MPPGAQLLVCAVVVFAAWIVTHVALVVRLLGVTEITRRQWFFSWVFAPVLGWRFKRWHTVLWGCLFALYVALLLWLTLR